MVSFCNCAEGMFLWVSMAVKELGKAMFDQREKTLEKLQKGLESVYRQILSVMNDDDEDARAILNWVTFAFRLLTSGEFCPVSAIEVVI